MWDGSSNFIKRKMITGPRNVKYPSLSRIEFVILTGLILIAWTLRGWKFSEIGLQHFDEGIYALSASALVEKDPESTFLSIAHRFSPPLYYGLVAFFASLHSQIDSVAIALNIVAGTLSVALIWLVGRAWFGPPAGVAAAALLAMYECHILLSRSALTDVLFLLFFSFSLWLATLALQKQNLKLAVLAGLLTGLAWNTKYHGWTVQLFTATGTILYFWKFKLTREDRKRISLVWVLITIVACICILPWFLYIQSQPEGYSGWAAHMASHLRSNWLENWIQHMAMQQFLNRIPSSVSIFAGLFCVLLVSEKHFGSVYQLILILISLAIGLFLTGPWIVICVLGLLAFAKVIHKPAAYSDSIAIASLGILIVLVPFYRPYFRLILPFSFLLFLFAGKQISDFQKNEGTKGSRVVNGSLILLAGIIMGILIFDKQDSSNLWRNSRRLAEVTREMQQVIPNGSPVVVFGEPSLSFYLHSNHRKIVRLNAPYDLRGIQSGTYVVTGFYAKGPDIRKVLRSVRFRMKFLKRYSFIPGDLRLLDDLQPEAAGAYRMNPDDRFDLNLFLLE
jgi:4-amino-4-deoxy-L-arabinose transferase-like glycosyltransferase